MILTCIYRGIRFSVEAKEDGSGFFANPTKPEYMGAFGLGDTKKEALRDSYSSYKAIKAYYKEEGKPG